MTQGILVYLAARLADGQQYTGPFTPEGKAACFFHGTKLPISLETKGGDETNGRSKLPSRHGGEEQVLTGRAARGGRRGGQGSLPLVGRGNDRQAARTAASQSHNGCGKVRGRSSVCLRSNPECPFVSTGSCSRLHLRSRIQMVTHGDPRGGAARPRPLERGAAARHGVRLGPAAEGVETKAGKCKKTGG
jgi:hypothetical protein